MNRYIVYFVLISFLLGVLMYISSDNILIALITFLVYLTYLILFASKKIIRSIDKERNYHLCYNFINSFVVGINIKGTLLGGYESATQVDDNNFIRELSSVEHLDLVDRLESLKPYFPYAIYALFVEQMKIYEEQGGDIIKMSKGLIDESRREEDYILNVSRKGKSKAIEVSILWFFVLLILIMVRFSLGNFFDIVRNRYIYLFLMAGFFIFMLLALHISISTIFAFDIKEGEKNG